MKYLAVGILVLLAGCAAMDALFGVPAHTAVVPDGQGGQTTINVPATPGIIPQLQTGAAATGLPWGTAVAGVLGVIGYIGAWIQTKRYNKAIPADVVVPVIDAIKEKTKGETVGSIVKYELSSNPRVAAILQAAYDADRAEKSKA